MQTLNAELNAVLTNQEVREKFGRLGMQVSPGTPEELTARLHADVARWSNVVRQANIRSE